MLVDAGPPPVEGPGDTPDWRCVVRAGVELGDVEVSPGEKSEGKVTLDICCDGSCSVEISSKRS